MDTGRLHWYEPGELDEAQRKIYDAVTAGPRSSGPQVMERTDAAGRLYGPFNAMMIDPGVGDAVQALGAAIRYQTEMTSRVREIAILQVASAHKAEFEWYAHRAIGRQAGLSEEQIEAIRSGAEAPELSEEEAEVRRVVHQLVAERDLSDADYQAAVGRLGLRLIADLVYLVGYYEMLARSMAVFRTPLPPGNEPAF